MSEIEHLMQFEHGLGYEEFKVQCSLNDFSL